MIRLISIIQHKRSGTKSNNRNLDETPRDLPDDENPPIRDKSFIFHKKVISKENILVVNIINARNISSDFTGIKYIGSNHNVLKLKESISKSQVHNHKFMACPN